MNKKIGFCCKWIDTPAQVNGIKPTDSCKKYTTGTTTITWLNKQTPRAIDAKLWGLVKHNLTATNALVRKVGLLAPPLRMVRLSSDILPVFTHPSYSWWYEQPSVVAYLTQEFKKIGDIARRDNVRLSFHPGQFTCLASDRDDVVANSIAEFEYHATMAQWMGYGVEFQDMKINVHIAGKRGAAGMLESYSQLSNIAKNCISIENDETSYGLDDCLEISDIIPVVLDIHHHFIKTGEYIAVDDPRISQVINSWRGKRPVMHYSISREDILVSHCKNTKPDLTLLLEAGHKKQHLRAHSDFFWNNPVNDWALSFWDRFDIQCESKAKNLASFELYNYATTNSIES